MKVKDYQEYTAEGECERCGKGFLKASPNQRFCLDCKAEISKDPRCVDKHYCAKKKQCVYGRPMYECGIWFCDYIGIMGRKRPCPVQGCTEFKPRRGKK